MGVYIKGFEMPENCLNCTMRIGIKCYVAPSYVDDTRVAPNVDEVLKGGKPNWCPFVEIPTPHGRLIDENEIVGVEWRTPEGHLYTTDGVGYEVDAPTVIEAEE